MISALRTVFLRNCLDAWLDGLVPFLPGWAMDLIAGERRVIRLKLKTSAADTRLCDRNRGTSVKLSDREAAKLSRYWPAVLEVPPRHSLTREVSLPDAALRDLDSAMRHNIGVWTPFSADEVYFTARVRETKNGKSRIEMHVIQKIYAAKLISQSPVKPDRLELHPSAPQIDIDPSKAKRLRFPGRVDLALGICALTLVVVAFGVMSFRIESEAAKTAVLIRQEIAHLKKEDALKTALAVEEQRLGLVAAEQARTPPLTEIIGAIAEALPLDAQVLELNWSGLEGRAVIASKTPPNFTHAIGRTKLDAFRVELQRMGDGTMFDIGLRIGAR